LKFPEQLLHGPAYTIDADKPDDRETLLLLARETNAESVEDF